MDIKTGSLIFIHGKGLIPDAIEYFDKGSFSHVCFSFPSDTVFETQYLVNTRIISNPYSESEMTVVDLGLSNEQVNKLINVSFSYLKDKYDIKQLFGILLFDLFKVNTNSKWNDKHKLICSELVLDVLHDIGYLSTEQHISLINATPNILYKFLINKVNNKTA